eukprot:CAMPEP_0185784678 /NCGR_PEP_ID=MMETSP1174-20130828/124683_1 /TAXON_ID=35687 /ORGANISM="Dictyocha speculum, Strain CCMP1381" /LENGTH=53 /DNA_ID=CAMNT_0028476383 /DNA_START=40 /DNA_END=198 /DNA_ORIENTATION=+
MVIRPRPSTTTAITTTATTTRTPTTITTSTTAATPKIPDDTLRFDDRIWVLHR